MVGDDRGNALGVVVDGREDFFRWKARRDADVAPDVHEEHGDVAFAGFEGAAARQFIDHDFRYVALQRVLHLSGASQQLLVAEVAQTLRGVTG